MRYAYIQVKPKCLILCLPSLESAGWDWDSDEIPAVTASRTPSATALRTQPARLATATASFECSKLNCCAHTIDIVRVLGCANGVPWLCAAVYNFNIRRRSTRTNANPCS